MNVAGPDVPNVVSVIASCLAFHVAADVILLSANVPVHPNVRLVACNKAVLGDPPSVRVTFVSSVFVKAAGVTTAVALSVFPERESPVPSVISSITPTPADPLPINLLVDIDVLIFGVAPPLDVMGEVAVTLLTPEGGRFDQLAIDPSVVRNFPAFPV